MSSPENLYSVPANPGPTVEARLYPSYVEIRDEGRCIARHERCYGRQQQVLDLEHYLDVLERKPGALMDPSRSWRGAHEVYGRRITTGCSTH